MDFATDQGHCYKYANRKIDKIDALLYTKRIHHTYEIYIYVLQKYILTKSKKKEKEVLAWHTNFKLKYKAKFRLQNQCQKK